MEIEAGSSSSLVLFPGALGDAVCVEPAVAWLASHGPVTFRARGGAAAVAALFPARPEVASLDTVDVARLFSPAADGDGGSDWLRRYGRVVSFTGAASPVFMTRLRAAGNARVFPFPARAGPGHAADEMLDCVSDGRGTAGAIPRLYLEAGAPGGPERRLLIHPGSGGAGKRAPRELFREIGNRFRRHAAREVAVLLGPAEASERDWWAANLGDVICPRSVEDLGRCLAAACVYLGNDAGPSHVAAALGIPSVVLFRTTAAARFGPRGPSVRSVHLGGGVADAEALWEVVEAAVP